jgi:hypothetical protein
MENYETDVNGRIILKWILKKQDLRMWTGFNCIHILVFWVVTPCSLLGGDPRVLSFELCIGVLSVFFKLFVTH